MAKRILVVEDEAPIREMLCFVLERAIMRQICDTFMKNITCL